MMTLKPFSIFLLLITALPVFAQTSNSLDFDNVDDVVSVPNASELIAGSNEISMTCWVNLKNPNPGWPDFDGICGFRNEFDASFYLLHLNTTTIEARLRNSQFTSFTMPYDGVQSNEWIHLALVYNGAELILYHNGEFGTSMIATGLIESPIETFWIGSLPFQANPFNLLGQVDEVSLWSKALSEDEINCIYQHDIDPESSNLELYYKMDQGETNGDNNSITELMDETGNINGILNNFTLNGTTSNFVDGVFNSTLIESTACAGTMVEYNGQDYIVPGTYEISFTTAAGCDSTVQLSLSGLPSPNADVSLTGGDTLMALTPDLTYQWVDCNDNLSPVPGANQQLFIPEVSGSYAVSVVSPDGCEATSECYDVVSVSTHEISPASNLILYPNPTAEVLNIHFASGEMIKEVLVKTLDGKELTGVRMIHSSQAQLSVSHLPQGLYLLEVYLEDQSVILQKWVKGGR
jgi:hypothetical protein